MSDSQADSLNISMSSGETIRARKLKLFPEPLLEQIIKLKTKAQNELGKFSTGIGFWGSPSWVIGGASVLAVIESAITNSKTKKGLQLLRKAQEMQNKSRENGRYFPISEVSGLNEPDPTRWRASGNSLLGDCLDLKLLGMFATGELILKYDLKKDDLKNGPEEAEANIPFVYDGGEFFWVETDDKSIAIRWSSVETFHPITQ
jgi:hypothetical protein